MKKRFFWPIVIALFAVLVYYNIFETPLAGAQYVEAELTNVAVGEEKTSVEAYLDSFEVEDQRFGLYKFSGWAYQATGKVVQQREVFLILQPVDEEGNVIEDEQQYSVPCGELKARGDVEERTDGISKPIPNTVGFENVVFSIRNIKDGNYRIYFQVVEDGVEETARTDILVQIYDNQGTII